MPSNNPQNKPRSTFEQRQRRRNLIIFWVLSGFLILSMLISLVKFY